MSCLRGLVMSAALEAIITKERLGRYLTESGFDLDRALQLYAWNLKISAAFVPLLCAAEISLRNIVMVRSSAVFGPVWWQSSAFLGLAGSTAKGIVKSAENKIVDRGIVPTTGRMTAELSFGFWENMLLPKYQPALWTPIHLHFPDLPTRVDRQTLYERCGKIRVLRNRISHHEPIFRRNISQDYADCVEFIGWLSSAKAAWITPHCNVMALMRTKP